MSVLLHGYQLRALNYGQQVIASAKTFPQTATATLFTVATGNVLVTSFFGILTTATTTDPQITLGTAATGCTAATSGLATTTAITSKEVGCWLGVLPASGKAGALVVGATGSAVLFSQTAFVVAPGTITITTAASQGGAASWYLTYVSLDNGASVS